MLDIMNDDENNRYMILRKIRGTFDKKPHNEPRGIEAKGRNSWIGWFELKTDTVREAAIENTARVFNAVDADVLCVVEAEDRVALKRFNEFMIPVVNGRKYDHVMLIDGNDDRGIDVGIMTRHDFPITRMMSHVDDKDGNNPIFSRDCAEYVISTGQNNLLLLVNHFKSKGYGSQTQSNARRRRQAQRVREIYEERLSEFPLIAIVGDFNDTPTSGPLEPLLGDGQLVDAMAHPRFVNSPNDNVLGTFGKAQTIKFDYILMSPELSRRVDTAGVERRGVWRGVRSRRKMFDDVESELDAASDHAAVWVELDIEGS
jgi:endonuclease/exonuclease/phosphatase family metal-dependent hydrolase